MALRVSCVLFGQNNILKKFKQLDCLYEACSPSSLCLFQLFSFLKIYLFYLLLAVLGLSCGMQDLSLPCAGFSLVVVCGFSLL